MILIFVLIFTSIPVFSSAWDCRYNQSAYAPRKTLVLELENKFIRIEDAEFNIIPSENRNLEKNKLFLGVYLFFIKGITFKGYINTEGERKYLEKTLYSLNGYRSKIDEAGRCTVTFLEDESYRTDITTEEETAILTLAESCIQSHVCHVDLDLVDNDGNLAYQSTQSALNALADFYISKLLNYFLGEGGSVIIPISNVTSGDFYFYEHGGSVKGLDTIQRTKDLYIKHEDSKFIIEAGFRVSEFEGSFNKAIVGWKGINTFGDFSAIIQGMSFLAKIEINLQPCSISIQSFQVTSFKNIKATIPIWNLFSFSYHFRPEELALTEKLLLAFINSQVSQINFDCQPYINILPELLG